MKRSEPQPGDVVILVGGRTGRDGMDGRSIYLARHECGRNLAKEQPAAADVVIAVPDSGNVAAMGYAEQSGIPFGIGLIKNRYVGRTFIQPDQKMRDISVRLKLNVLKENVEGKRVVMKWSDKRAVTVVLASGGYPGSYEKGKVISGLGDVDDDCVVFHAGTKFDESGNIVTNGGRVLGVMYDQELL